MKRIAIIGYGRMGKEIEMLLLSEGHTISVVIDNENDWKEKREQFINSDVAIEFSTPETTVENIKRCFQCHIPVVSGTTGWYHRINEVFSEAEKKQGNLIYGANFSIGANLFFMLNVQLAQWVNKLEQYDVEVEEIHHVKKIDAPSGTAITTAQLIIENLKRKNSWTMNNVPAQNEIKVIAKREGDVAGIHKVSYDSPEDVIQIIHQAKNRKGLAKGALKAAVWLTENPGVYEFKDVFLDILK